MKFTPATIPEIILVEPQVFGDQRGFFMETWQDRKFSAAGIDRSFVQDKLCRFPQDTLRGLHYQLQQPQGQLLRVLAGEIFHVAVDLRRSSPTFGHWEGTTISADNRRMLWIPPGFALGFYVASREVEIFSKYTDYGVPEQERTIRWDDPELKISWPLSQGETPLLSGAGTSFKDAEVYP